MIVLLSGPPAVGKSTLGRHLRATFGVPLVDRDDVKFLVYPLGPRDQTAAASRDIWRVAVEMIVAAGRSVIADPIATWPPDWQVIPNWVRDLGDDVFEVHLTAPPEVTIDRFRHRADPPLEGVLERHVTEVTDLYARMGRLAPDQPGQVFDTTDPAYTVDDVVEVLAAKGLSP